MLATQVAATTDAKLNQPLLRFHEASTAQLPLLDVNFDPTLVRLLKETKSFLLLDVKVCLFCCVLCVRLHVLRSS